MRVLITGASKGIGEATAEIFIKNNYEVEIPSHDELDLLNIDSIKKYIEKTKDIPLDTIINNAGINEITELEHASDEVIDSMLTVNLRGPIYLIRGSIPRLKKNSCGRIVNIGSIWAVVSKAGRSLYSATKNGLHGITNSLAIELAKYGILVNTVCPGFTLTELTIKNNTHEQIKAISKQIPLCRMAKPEEIAKVIYFLGSNENEMD
ncbi:MAG: SDR family oxidoreductase [Neisseriaceae bacterium]|nr:SDR family oxidoreductase [Neisseriaceae bacterium]